MEDAYNLLHGHIFSIKNYNIENKFFEKVIILTPKGVKIMNDRLKDFTDIMEQKDYSDYLFTSKYNTNRLRRETMSRTLNEIFKKVGLLMKKEISSKKISIYSFKSGEFIESLSIIHVSSTIKYSKK